MGRPGAIVLNLNMPVMDGRQFRAAPAGDFDPAELPHGKRSAKGSPFALAVLPLVVVIVTNFLMSLVVFPRVHRGHGKQHHGHEAEPEVKEKECDRTLTLRHQGWSVDDAAGCRSMSRA